MTTNGTLTKAETKRATILLTYLAAAYIHDDHTTIERILDEFGPLLKITASMVEGAECALYGEPSAHD